MQFNVDRQRAYAYTGGKTFDPKLPVIAFIHGAQNDHSVWGLQSRYLAHHGYAVLAFDLPGHGRSAGAPLPSIEAMAQWTTAALVAIGVERAHWVGHSMGSLIALQASGDASARVASLCLIGTAFPMRVSDALLATARDNEPLAIDMINAWSFSGLTHSPGSPGPGFSPFVMSRRLMERQAPGTLFNDFDACNRYRHGEAHARNVSCPTLFILGERDMMTTPKAASPNAPPPDQASSLTGGSGASKVRTMAARNIAAMKPADVHASLRRTVSEAVMKAVELLGVGRRDRARRPSVKHGLGPCGMTQSSLTVQESLRSIVEWFPEATRTENRV